MTQVTQHVFPRVELLSFLGYVTLLPTRVLGLLNQQKLIRGQTRNSAKIYWGPSFRGKEKKQQVPLLVFLLWGASQFLIWAEGRVCVQGSGWRGDLGGVICSRHAQYPAFAPNTLFLLQAPEKQKLGYFGLFVSFALTQGVGKYLRYYFYYPSLRKLVSLDRCLVEMRMEFRLSDF